ncbi:MAG TPA: biopolymer transporter ExbD, partial [Negativicutes bacterium]|nr:biopolymer transporter ExbD [Negativicutes bacterium]
MKLDKLRSNQSPRLMIIPMIDIIFFLLVFFMMSTLY